MRSGRPQKSSVSRPISNSGWSSRISSSHIDGIYDRARAAASTYADIYGKDRDITPALDRLAAESVVYDRAYTTTPMTLPSHTSLMTGLDPYQHRVRDNAAFQLSPDVELLAELFAARARLPKVVTRPSGNWRSRFSSSSLRLTP